MGESVGVKNVLADATGASLLSRCDGCAWHRGGRNCGPAAEQMNPNPNLTWTPVTVTIQTKHVVKKKKKFFFFFFFFFFFLFFLL